MIPKVVHHIWIGGPLPGHLSDCVDSWRTHHPSWDHRLWGDGDLDWLAHRDLYDRAPNLVPRDAVGQLRADIARFEILHRYGGLYADCDTIALRPVDDALTGHDAWAAAEDTHWVGNTYLACTPGHPVMADLVNGLRASITAQRGRRPNRMTGPQYLTPIWRRHGCHIAEQQLWFPYSYADVKADTVPDDVGDAYTVHLWQHTRDVLGARRR
jgi:mannosyltransferase OCH1-like enzyme